MSLKLSDLSTIKQDIFSPKKVDIVVTKFNYIEKDQIIALNHRSGSEMTLFDVNKDFTEFKGQHTLDACVT